MLLDLEENIHLNVNPVGTPTASLNKDIERTENDMVLGSVISMEKFFGTG